VHTLSGQRVSLGLLETRSPIARLCLNRLQLATLRRSGHPPVMIAPPIRETPGGQPLDVEAVLKVVQEKRYRGAEAVTLAVPNGSGDAVRRMLAEQAERDQRIDVIE
jgi:hypothetical protein